MQTRREILKRSLILGCSAAASPLITPVTFAATPWENRLVVILLRGAMDGLDVVRPFGDPDFAALRPNLNVSDGFDLGSGFRAHSGLSDLAPLWQAGELGFVHAVSTPYRDARSHFDGQDLLEAGQADIQNFERVGREGWLNRLLSQVPNATSDTAYAVGQEELMILAGDQPVSRWSPGQMMALSPSTDALLARIYDADPLFHEASQKATQISGQLVQEKIEETGSNAMMSMNQNMAIASRGARGESLARFSASRLRKDARIAAFSIGGWDTHRGQAKSILRPLSEVSKAILTLRDELGDDLWGKTTVLCMTEFGRTAHENGTKGTDHGTAGAMITAGGAIKGKRVYTDWPGLSEADLYQRRDLMPMGDVRAYAAHVLQGLFGVSDAVLSGHVFPGVDLSHGKNILL